MGSTPYLLILSLAKMTPPPTHPMKYTLKPPIMDTPKEDKPPNRGQAESTLVYTLYRKSPLKEDNLSTKDKMAGPESVLIKRFHCSSFTTILTFYTVFAGEHST